MKLTPQIDSGTEAKFQNQSIHVGRGRTHLAAHVKPAPVWTLSSGFLTLYVVGATNHGLNGLPTSISILLLTDTQFQCVDSFIIVL